MDWTPDELANRCDRAYDTFIDEVSGANAPQVDDDYIDGSKNTPTGALSWRDAINHVGSTKYVCGPLANRGASRDDVFLNLGRGYPDKGRFTIVVWDVGRIESIPKGTTLCTTGRITLYKGVPQIEVRDSDAVKIAE